MNPGCSRCNRGDVFSASIRTEHPGHKVILVFEMIIEHWVFYICSCTDLCYANLVDEFVREKAGRYALPAFSRISQSEPGHRPVLLRS